MSKELGKEYSNPDERKAFLHDNCEAAETLGYMKRFSPEQITQMKNELSEISIEINDIEEEKKEVMQSFKARLDPLNEIRKELLGSIKMNAVYVKETCYKFIDYENRKVEYYNQEGDMVSERPILPQEMQKTILHFKTGTDNN